MDKEKRNAYMREWYRKKVKGYEAGKIYKIYCDENDEVYYGSTKQELYMRERQHKSLKYVSRNIMKNTYHIELVENYPCNNKKELELRERYYIENNKCINKSIPTRTNKEYQETHRKENNDKTIKWYKNNKEQHYNRTKWRRSFGDERTANCLLKIKMDLFD